MTTYDNRNKFLVRFNCSCLHQREKITLIESMHNTLRSGTKPPRRLWTFFNILFFCCCFLVRFFMFVLSRVFCSLSSDFKRRTKWIVFFFWVFYTEKIEDEPVQCMNVNNDFVFCDSASARLLRSFALAWCRREIWRSVVQVWDAVLGISIPQFTTSR